MADEFWCVLAPPDANSLGLVYKSVQLAQERRLVPCAVVIGRHTEPVFGDLFSLGVRRIYAIDTDTDDVNAEYGCRKCLAELVRSRGPEAVLFEYSVFSGSVAPAMASELDKGITADCTRLRWDGDFGLLQIRPTFGGRKTAVNRSVSIPYIATVRKGVFALPGDVRRSDETGETLRITPPAERNCFRTLKVLESAVSDVGLSGAKIVLSGGLGLGSRDNFAKLHKLSRLTGAAVGASRAAVAAGYATYLHQVGQTGVSVNPDVYVAFGISGAVQHLSGIMGAVRIIAINTDPKAPIHSYSDYSVIADCGEVLDALIAGYSRDSGAGIL